MTENKRISDDQLLNQFFKANVHLGHKSTHRNPKNNRFIWGKRNGMDIIDLRISLQKTRTALSEIERYVENGGKVLFVGTKSFASALIKEYAEKVEMPFVNRRWLGGTLTNFKTIKQSIKKMLYLESMIANNKFDNMTKKEKLMQDRKCRDLAANLGGLRDLNSLPDILFVIDANHDRIAVQEANKLGIPVVSIVDTNTSDEGISYGIPGNDDSMKAINLYLDLISNSIAQGAAKIKPEKKILQAKKTAGAKVEKAPAKKVDAKRVVTVKSEDDKSVAKRVVTVKKTTTTAKTKPVKKSETKEQK